ncbi:hypothetical protein GSI_05146 [Ganoderma sinense ZZ0214-1]|uniref:HNH nuclease domain-containing protein n=1 Tax=Ganoderma sinense ZZ0214-1 TaxID=1077348 RepID=A0A2G8SF83_9APHY|nr:hypothetical protein GSI_05146 [Ganoderma sinense ZZ0214-1]
MALRPRLPPLLSPVEITKDDEVLIYHPAVGRPLFIFPAYSDEVDLNDSLKTVSGVCCSLVLDSCRIITNYAASNQDDFLATDREGKISIDGVQPLTTGVYYYFLGPPNVAANCNYPVVKDFSAFRFPAQLPRHWYDARATARHTSVQIVSASNMSNHVVWRDKYCALSTGQSFIQCAHLVPKSEEAWYDANEMFVHAFPNMQSGINALANGISLRDDLHRCFDSYAFVFYPVDRDGFMAYFVGEAGYPDYTESFHRRLATIHPSVAVEFLYARFAYTVVNLLHYHGLLFDAVEDNERVKEVAAKLSSNREVRRTKPSGGNEEESDKGSSSASHSSVQSSPQMSYAGGDERWRDTLSRRLPDIAALEEVEYPPDTTVACHMETPHMLRLMSKYMRENPQVWQTSSTPADATRDDVEGYYARLMTRPSSA